MSAGRGVERHTPYALIQARSAAVADDTPNMVVEAVQQVRCTGVRITLAPAVHEDFHHVGAVIAVRILEEQGVRSHLDNDAAVGEHKARRDVQVLCEHDALVRQTVTVSVFENDEAVVALAKGTVCDTVPGRR